MDEQLEDCGAEIVHYTSRVKLSELPKGPLPGDVTERMTRQLERALVDEFEDLPDLLEGIRKVSATYEPPTNFPLGRRLGHPLFGDGRQFLA